MENNKGSRVVGSVENIDYSKVSDFFEHRSHDNDKKHKYNYVMYLDNDPETAIQRDKQCKERVSGLLDIRPGMKVLDVGCGIGRWGEMLCSLGVEYVGIDACAKMIDRAKENLAAFDNKTLIVGNVQELTASLKRDGLYQTYDIILAAGILMYLNDRDVQLLLSELPALSGSGTQICFLESMSDKERLTLKDIYSQELDQEYSAIYRSQNEFLTMMKNSFGSGFELVCNEVMDYSDGLQKKREHVTMEHCVIWKAVR